MYYIVYLDCLFVFQYSVNDSVPFRTEGSIAEEFSFKEFSYIRIFSDLLQSCLYYGFQVWV